MTDRNSIYGIATADREIIQNSLDSPDSPDSSGKKHLPLENEELIEVKSYLEEKQKRNSRSNMEINDADQTSDKIGRLGASNNSSLEDSKATERKETHEYVDGVKPLDDSNGHITHGKLNSSLNFLSRTFSRHGISGSSSSSVTRHQSTPASSVTHDAVKPLTARKKLSSDENASSSIDRGRTRKVGSEGSGGASYLANYFTTYFGSPGGSTDTVYTTIPEESVEYNPGAKVTADSDRHKGIADDNDSSASSSTQFASDTGIAFGVGGVRERPINVKKSESLHGIPSNHPAAAAKSKSKDGGPGVYATTTNNSSDPEQNDNKTTSFKRFTINTPYQYLMGNLRYPPTSNAGPTSPATSRKPGETQKSQTSNHSNEQEGEADPVQLSKRIRKMIKLKRDNVQISVGELRDDYNYFIDGIVTNSINPGQIGALLMAIRLNGITYEETLELTRAMLHNPSHLKTPVWPESWKNLIVDKFTTTGGLGDKITLILVPALAACGLKVPKITKSNIESLLGTFSSNNTSKKLESIPGFITNLGSGRRIVEILDLVGCCIFTPKYPFVASGPILDLYRDITATNDCLNLLAASTIAEKRAAEISALIMDVKYGPGTPCHDRKEALEFSELCVKLGKELGVKVRCLLTKMGRPLGRCIGDALEISEAVQTLRAVHKAPQELVTLVCELGGNLLDMTGQAENVGEGHNKIKSALADGRALRCFKEMMVFQGVDEAFVNKLTLDSEQDCYKILRNNRLPFITSLQVSDSGFVKDIDGTTLAEVYADITYKLKSRTKKFSSSAASSGLGSEQHKSSSAPFYGSSLITIPASSGNIKHGLGIQILVNFGDYIEAGDSWIKVFHETVSLSALTMERISNSITLSEVKPDLTRYKIFTDLIR